MNTLGQIIRVIQTVVLVLCSIRLAVGRAPLRRSSRMADVVRWSLTAGILMQGIANSFWAKYSSLECAITQWSLFVVLLIFYKISFWQLLIQLLLYWSGVKLFGLAVVFYACYFRNIPVVSYLDDMSVPWSVLHLAVMLVLIFFLIGFTYLKKGHLLFECRTVKDYLLVSAIVLGERILEDYVFSPDMAFDVLEGEYILFCGVLLLVFVCGSSVLILARAYYLLWNRERMSEMQTQSLQEQYKLLRAVSQERRRQSHDMHQHHIMLLGYLNNGQIDVAVHYLNEWMKDTYDRQSDFYTGCDTVDIMLQNKIAEAERFGIQMKMEIAVLFSPIKDTDMSVLIGNLLDNAIEAVKNLEGNERWIRLRMQTVNHIFIFEIKNPYAGNLKIHNGSYETTKADKSLHGFGLESVRKIVSANDGDVEIRHEQNVFSVCVTLFKNKDKN